jgi:Tfp pilus assembly protein PilE
MKGTIRFMKHIKTKRTQRGLSLLMTMLIIVIIGILAEVALLSYEEFVAQEQVIKK